MLGAKCWQDQEARFLGYGCFGGAEQNGQFQQMQSEQKYQAWWIFTNDYLIVRTGKYLVWFCRVFYWILDWMNLTPQIFGYLLESVNNAPFSQRNISMRKRSRLHGKLESSNKFEQHKLTYWTRTNMLDKALNMIHKASIMIHKALNIILCDY